ncbi:MAG: biotin/lipoyl-binding protein, partial [Sphingosinicella sp.]|nr:biotin/lipoyl-binding protein [Sphingosinicella sp.]
MAIEIKLPAMSPTMEEGTLAKWLVKEGDDVKPGDVIAEIETDKATMELETDEGGVLSKILVPAGSDGVAVGTLIAVIDNGEGEVAAKAEKPAVKEDAPAALPEQKIEAPSGAKAIPTPQPEIANDPEIPAGTNLRRMTVREALRDAMAEEMRTDSRVFVMGEEVAEYQGAYKVTQGLLEEFGPARVIDTPITEYGFAGLGTGAA